MRETSHRTTIILFWGMLLSLSMLLHSPASSDAIGSIILWPDIQLTNIASGFNQPLFATHSNDGTARIFIVERGGKVRILNSGEIVGTPFLDISGLVTTVGSEQGLLGIAFPPDYATKGYFYVNYTRSQDGASVISRFYRSWSDPNIAVPSSEQFIMIVEQPLGNHNGGSLAFSPVDHFLYIGMGDGGGGGDPFENAQDPSSLLGNILRIDVESIAIPLTEPTPPADHPHKVFLPLVSLGQHELYLIPESNPFFGNASFQDEIWAFGVRNPWRFSFDSMTGDIFIADVGQGTREEVNFQPSASIGGENYGWNIMEGSLCYNASSCDMSGLTLPVVDYAHDVGCSITGGYVYRGSAIPALQGIYLYGDFCTGRIWGLQFDTDHWESIELLDTNLQISSFGEDEDGNLYVIDYSTGNLHRIDEVLP
jgi:glucose/arabinose dehydrogenase